MGVRGLWEVVKPVARPVTLESLARKRLAVDASIWIYQFLKAVRDGQGNAVRNSHIIGFFRRICKLLYFDIKPVFVFDGDAPTLKKRTITRRNQRRQGRQEAAAQTAAKLLTVQLQRLAGNHVKQKAKKSASTGDDIPNNAVYYDNRDQVAESSSKLFRAQDQYHLPELENKAVIEASDPRLMTEEELAQYAAEFGSQLSSGLYDTSLVDFESPEFEALPITTQYQLLNTARLRSRLRMGYSAEQLEKIFPDRMEFSKFQIQRVSQRNFFTQRLMGLVGLDEDLTRRVSSEKGKEYILKRNDNGWTLDLGHKGDAVINLDGEPGDATAEGSVTSLKQSETAQNSDAAVADSDEEVEFEDVPIEETSQLPKPKLNLVPEIHEWEELDTDEPLPESLNDFEAQVQRMKFYENRQSETKPNEAAPSRPKPESKVPAPSIDPSWETAFKGSSLLFDDEDDAEKVDTGEVPGPVVLPPWFLGVDNEDDIPQKDSPAANDGIMTYEEARKILRDRHEGDQATESLPAQGSEREPIELDSEATPEVELIESVEVESHSTRMPLDKKGGQTQLDQDSPLVSVPPLSESPITPAMRPVANVDQTGGMQQDVQSETSDSGVTAEKLISPRVKHQFETVHSDETNAKEVHLEDVQPKVEVHEAVEPVAVGQSPEWPDEPAEDEVNPQVVEELAAEEAKFEDEEEDELLESMERELEESERFTKTLNNGKLAGQSAKDYEREITNLRQQQNREARDADQVTQTMISECQELLRRFGIPYISAPMEAEAQCATLMQLGLVDGIVTDDSDCFLFGGERVYKNMFNQSKFVESYDGKDLEREFDLDRKKMIKLAQLLGSDYTDGLPGVGPVTALELLAEFNTEDGLERFRDWWKQVQRVDSGADYGSDFRRKFRKHASKLFLSDSFPDANVEKAYLEPIVDTDPTPFEWGVPNLDSLRTYLIGMTGWPKEKVDEMLLPVIQDINKRKQRADKVASVQTTLNEWARVPARKKVELGASKRMRDAMHSLVEQASHKDKRARR